jgi:hypothetical protein
MSLLSTLALEFRANQTKFDKNNFLVTEAGITNTFKSQTAAADSIVDADLIAKARASAGRALKVSVLDYRDVTVRTTRPIVVPIEGNDSAFVTITWSTLAAGFGDNPAQHLNNEIERQRLFNANMQSIIMAFTKKLEELGAAALNANKTLLIGGASSGTTIGGHTLAAGVVSESVAALKDTQIYADLPMLQMQNDFPTFGMDVVGNPGLGAIMRRLEGFGENNTENKRIQYGNVGFQWSNSIANAAGKAATGYAIAPAQLGMLTRMEPDSLLGTQLRSGAEWGTMILPGLNIPVGTYEYDGVIDRSGDGAHVAHLSRTGQTVFDFAFDVAHVVAYNQDSATRPAGIIKFDTEVV